MTIFNLGPGSGRAFVNSNPRMIRADAPNVIAEFSALGVPRSKARYSTLNESLAAECAIWYCIQAHNISVQLGQYSDTIIDTWSEATGSIQSGNVTFINIPPTFNVDSNEHYGLGFMQMLGMRKHTSVAIVGNVTADGGLNFVWPSTNFAEGLHNSFDDLDAWMERLTRSLTNNIRLNSTAVTKPVGYQGAVFGTQVIVVVRWAWIVYPAALVLLAVAFVVVEIVRTALSDIQPWKTDVFLPLCMDMGDEVREHASHGVCENGGIAKRIGDYRVRLRSGDDGLVKFDVEEKVVDA
jgi:hypothetical protein